MHELSVTEGILKVALDEAKKNNAVKIIHISLSMGVLNGIVPECVTDYFEVLSEGTIAEGATLSFNKISGRVRCRDCGKESEMTHFRFMCEHCKGRNVDVIQGKEFYVENMEIES